jgi:hypothetical protein
LATGKDSIQSGGSSGNFLATGEGAIMAHLCSSVSVEEPSTRKQNRLKPGIWILQIMNAPGGAP